MKVTVDLDCTAVEFRELMGLPDLKPMQEKLLAELEKKVLSEVDRFSAESLVRQWITSMPDSAGWMKDIFAASAQKASSKQSD